MKIFKFINAAAVLVVLGIAFASIPYQGLINTVLSGMFCLGVFQLLSGIVLALIGKKAFWKYFLIALSYLLCIVLVGVESEGGIFFFQLILFPFAIAAYFTYLCFTIE